MVLKTVDSTKKEARLQMQSYMFSGFIENNKDYAI